jgi:hypothetical protein
MRFGWQRFRSWRTETRKSRKSAGSGELFRMLRMFRTLGGSRDHTYLRALV